MPIRNPGMIMAGAALLLTPFGTLAAEQPDNAPGAQETLAPESEPAATQAIVQDYDPDPAIWRLADEDTTIYLFGTYHFLPPGLAWRTAQFDEIVREADELVVETSVELMLDEATGAGMAAILAQATSERTPTSQLLSPEAAEKWRKLADLGGTPFDLFDSMPPIMAILGLGTAMIEDRGSSAASGVDLLLEDEFAAAGKPVRSIEDPLATLRNMLSIDDALAAAQLEQDLAEWDGRTLASFFADEGEKSEDDEYASLHAWARGEPESDGMFGDGPFDRARQQVMLTDRNRAWAKWLDERLDLPGTVLVAVGAGHLEGRDSVQAMLAERDLTAIRMN